MEILTDSYGNWFLLGADLSVRFWDHEELEQPLPCRISLRELVLGYMQNPECVFDNEFLGLEVPASAPVQGIGTTQRSGLDRLRSAIPLLTNLACVAVAVRACQRERPARHFDQIPSWWSRFATVLDGATAMCQRVCLSGVAIDISQLRRVEELVGEAQESWWQGAGFLSADVFPCDMYADAVRSAARAAASLSDGELARRTAMGWSQPLATEPEAWRSLMLADIEYLLSAELGPSGSVGRPIPPEFFERPL